MMQSSAGSAAQASLPTLVVASGPSRKLCIVPVFTSLYCPMYDAIMFSQPGPIPTRTTFLSRCGARATRCATTALGLQRVFQVRYRALSLSPLTGSGMIAWITRGELASLTTLRLFFPARDSATATAAFGGAAIALSKLSRGLMIEPLLCCLLPSL